MGHSLFVFIPSWTTNQEVDNKSRPGRLCLVLYCGRRVTSVIGYTCSSHQRRLTLLWLSGQKSTILHFLLTGFRAHCQRQTAWVLSLFSEVCYHAGDLVFVSMNSLFFSHREKWSRMQHILWALFICVWFQRHRAASYSRWWEADVCVHMFSPLRAACCRVSFTVQCNHRSSLRSDKP